MPTLDIDSQKKIDAIISGIPDNVRGDALRAGNAFTCLFGQMMEKYPDAMKGGGTLLDSPLLSTRESQDLRSFNDRANATFEKLEAAALKSAVKLGYSELGAGNNLLYKHAANQVMDEQSNVCSVASNDSKTKVATAKTRVFAPTV